MPNRLQDTFLSAAITLSIVAAVYIIIQIIAYWRIFTKAGESGWKCLVPVLSQYTAFKIVWKPFMFFAALIIAAADLLFITLASLFAELTFLLMWLIMLTSAATLIMYIAFTHKLSRAFRHGVPFTIGLLLLQPVFILILALGGAEYHGADL